MELHYLRTAHRRPLRHVGVALLVVFADAAGGGGAGKRLLHVVARGHRLGGPSIIDYSHVLQQRRCGCLQLRRHRVEPTGGAQGAYEYRRGDGDRGGVARGLPRGGGSGGRCNLLLGRSWRRWWWYGADIPAATAGERGVEVGGSGRRGTAAPALLLPPHVRTQHRPQRGGGKCLSPGGGRPAKQHCEPYVRHGGCRVPLRDDRGSIGAAPAATAGQGGTEGAEEGAAGGGRRRDRGCAVYVARVTRA
jgi:hypothetical protein